MAKQYGKNLANAVEAVLEEEMQELEAQLSMSYTEIDLKLGTLPSRQELEDEVKNGPKYKSAWANNLLKQLDESGKLIESYAYPVQLWKIGSQTVVGLAGETVIDYAIRIKEVLGRETFVFGYCSEGNLSYIPSARIIEEGGYEGLTAQYYKGFPAAWSTEIENDIIGTVIELAKND